MRVAQLLIVKSNNKRNKISNNKKRKKKKNITKQITKVTNNFTAGNKKR